jgi:hypothetical protein
MAEIPPRRAGEASAFPQQAGVGLHQHATGRNSLPSAGVGTGAQAAHAVLFRRRTHRPGHPDARRQGVDHHPGDHGALPDPPCAAGANGEPAAAETVVTRGHGTR